MTDENNSAIWRRLDEHGHMLSIHDKQIGVLQQQVQAMEGRMDRHHAHTTEQLTRVEAKQEDSIGALNKIKGAVTLASWAIGSGGLVGLAALLYQVWGG